MMSCANMYSKYNSRNTENVINSSNTVEKNGNNANNGNSILVTKDLIPVKITNSEIVKSETIITDSAADVASNNLNERELHT